MIDFEDTIETQKLLLTRAVMILGGLGALTFVFQGRRPLESILCGCLSAILLFGQWCCGRKGLQKIGAIVSVLSSTIVIVVIIASSHQPGIIGTHYFFTAVVAATVVLLGKVWGAAILALIISFELAVTYLVPGDLSYSRLSRQILLDRVISLLIVFGTIMYSEHTMAKTLNSLKEKDRQLRLKEKLAALGVFAGGVSHEINNPLAIIKGFIGQIKRWMIKTEAPDEIQKKLDRLNSNVQRITDVTHSLLALGFDSPVDKSLTKLFSLNDAIEGALEILQSKLHHLSDIKVNNQVKSNLFAHGSLNHLRIMIRIIVDNALDALEIYKQSNKQINIKSSIKKGQILLFISDNGPGIPKDIQENIFDPFFTTKEVGKGSGVGLALVAKLCNSLDWTIRVESHPGSTEFVIGINHGQEILNKDAG